MVYKKVKGIVELKANESVTDLFVVRFKKPVEESKVKTFYFSLKVQDASGDIMLKYWGGKDKEKTQTLFDSINADDVIQVQGLVKEYNGKLDLSVNEPNLRVLKSDEYDLSDFIRVSEKDVEVMFKELKVHVDSISDPELKQVMDSFFGDEEFIKKFKFAPGAMYLHHGWVSGLLEHTLTVTNICLDVAKHHKVDKDLLIAGAVLHDIGKIEEFATTSLIKVTDKGNLVGHLTIGVQMLTRKLDQLSISENTKNKLLHILISHHGKIEYGCPKSPAFPEALIIAKADDLDAAAMQIIDIKESAKTEDSFVNDKKLGNVYLK